MHIHNLYNSKPNIGQSVMIFILRDVLKKTVEEKHISLEDLNLYHLVWREDDKPYCDDKVEELLQLMIKHQIERLLPSDSVSLDEREDQATIDLVFDTS